MTPVQIKIVLLKKGFKQKQIAQKLNVTPGMINGLITHKFKSARLQKEIAGLLKIDVEALWGEAEKKAA